MTRTQAERIIRSWQDRLGLERWDISIVWDEPTDAETNAKTWRSCYYDVAKVYFAKDWATWPRERFEQSAIHELLHLCHRDIDETWTDLDGQLHRDAWSIADLRYKQTMEGFIDRLAFRLLGIGGPA